MKAPSLSELGASNTLGADTKEEDTKMSDPLAIARDLIAMGAPVFVAKKCKPDCPFHRGRGSMAGFDLPMRWQHTPVDFSTLDRYEPGDALAMVGGHALDTIDVDPRNRGTLVGKPDLPRVYAEAATPSGGKHYIVKSLGVAKGEVFDGIDLQAGDALDTRGFVWIAPTIKASQDPADDGRMRPYVWIKKPDPEEWAEWSDSDDSGEVWRDARLARVSKKKTEPASGADPFSANPEYAGVSSAREFTRQQAQEHVRPFLTELAAQQRPGRIEELANSAATALFHFVPEFWSAEAAYGLLEKSARHALGGTWKDGLSEWSLEKFRAVLDGRRPPKDAWKATLTTDAPASVAPESEPAHDRLAAMRAKLLDFDALLQRPAPKPLIKGIIDLDSECWLIGRSGEYKSFVAVDWACHVATGREWRGRRVKQGRVLYVAAEGAAGIGKRIQGWAQHTETEPKDLMVLPMPVQVLRGDFEVLTMLAAELEPSMIVLDTQARMTAGMDENSAKDMGQFVDAVSVLRQTTGACVLTVHHVGRNGADARGSSAIDAAQDWEWKCERLGQRGLSARLTCQKSKDDNQDQRFDFAMDVIELGLDEDGDPINTLVPGQESTAPERTYEDAVRELDTEGRWKGNQQTIIKALRTLTADGAVSIGRSELFASYNALRVSAGLEKALRQNFNTTLNRMAREEEDMEKANPSYSPVLTVTATRVAYHSGSDK